MKPEDATIGARVHTTVSMADNETNWLAAREGVIVKVRDRGRYRIYVDIDGFPAGIEIGCNPIPFDLHELELGRQPWLR